RADFHALRHTFNARMAANGVPLAFAQRAMRHSDAKLTSNQYLDPALASLSKSLAELPGLLEDGLGSHIGSHFSGSEGHSPSQAVANGHKGTPTEVLENE